MNFKNIGRDKPDSPMCAAIKNIERPMTGMGRCGAMREKKDALQHSKKNILTRDFVLGFLAYFALLFTYFILIPTLPVYLVRLGSNEGEIGTLVGIYNVSALVSRLLAGGALSRYSEKKVMIFSTLLFTITFPAYIILRPFWPFFVVRLFQGFAYACFDTAVYALIIKVTPMAYLGRTLGYLMLAPGLAMVMAPSFGMFLVNQSGFTSLFIICIGVSLCSPLFSGILKEPQTTRPERAANNTFLLERKIIAPTMSAFFYSSVLGSITAFFALYAIQCGVTNPGYFFSANAIMTIAGRALGGKLLDAWSKEKIILTFTFASMVAMIILSLSRTLPMFIFVGLIWGVVVAFIFPASMAYSLDYAGSSGGTAVGTFRALMDLGFAVGPMVMGLIVPLTGYPVMFLCLAFICLINLAYFQFYVRRRRKQPQQFKARCDI
jgi:MFS family permease